VQELCTLFSASLNSLVQTFRAVHRLAHQLCRFNTLISGSLQHQPVLGMSLFPPFRQVWQIRDHASQTNLTLRDTHHRVHSKHNLRISEQMKLMLNNFNLNCIDILSQRHTTDVCIKFYSMVLTLVIFVSTGKSDYKVILKLHMIRYHESLNSLSILRVLIVKHLMFRHTLQLTPTD
jgi:hypothetical protein